MDLVFVKNREPSKTLRCKVSMVSHFSLEASWLKECKSNSNGAEENTLK